MCFFAKLWWVSIHKKMVILPPEVKGLKPWRTYLPNGQFLPMWYSWSVWCEKMVGVRVRWDRHDQCQWQKWQIWHCLCQCLCVTDPFWTLFWGIWQEGDPQCNPVMTQESDRQHYVPPLQSHHAKIKWQWLKGSVYNFTTNAVNLIFKKIKKKWPM